MRRIFFTIIILQLFFLTDNSLAQQQNSTKNGYHIFYYENGKVSSEGTLRDGKPDGYWKNYYENGHLKSEGNRKNFLLDSLWKFYDETGRLKLEIQYRNGKKNGYRTSWLGDEVYKEPFVNDVKQGNAYYFYPNGKIKMKIPFVDGLEQGTAYQYALDGRIIQIIRYKKGYVVSRERINQYDANGRPNGVWKWFYENEKVKMTGFYNHGLKNGYFKTYDPNGNLIATTKYVNGEKQKAAEKVNLLEVRTDYYPDGKVRVVGTYNKEGKPEGIRREYDEKGNVVRSYIFNNGRIVGEGIFTEAGEQEGFWKEFYLDGSLKASGFYSKDKKTGHWQYFYPNGQLEEEGNYVNNRPDSTWHWYYQDGKPLRIEHFFDGLEDGKLTEWDEKGNIVTQGEYIEGKREGLWVYQVGDTRQEITFGDDKRNGWSRYYDRQGTLLFEGKFVDDLPNGEHKWYWPGGKLKTWGHFSMGRKNGEWKKYDENGNLVFSITYQQGKEIKYDGVKVE